MAEQNQDKIKLDVTPEFILYSPGGQEKCWATVTMLAPFHEPTSRSEIDLVAVIDRSGSMSGSKIELVKETLGFIVDQLKEKDRFCLVSYASDVKVDIALTHMSKTEKESAKAIIKSLKATTSTALCDGLLCGMQQILKRSGEMAKVASVLLLTDGQANVGPTTKEAILEAMKKPMQFVSAPAPPPHSSQAPQRQAQRRQFNPFGIFGSNSSSSASNQAQTQQQAPVVQQQTQASNILPPPPQSQQAAVIQPIPVPPQGVTNQQAPLQPPPPPPPPPPPGPVVEVEPTPTTSTIPNVAFEGTIYTFGFGNDHSASLLEAISQAAEGSYYYIDSAEKIPESFADCLGGLLSVVGQNMEIVLTCANGCYMTDVHAKNPGQMSDGNTKCVIQLGDLQSEEERDVVVEVTLPATADEQSKWQVLNARLNYFNVISSMVEDVQADLVVDRKQAGLTQPNPAVVLQRMRISAVKSLKEARELAGKGNLEKARSVVKATIADIEKSELTEHKLIKFLLEDMRDIAESFASEHTYKGYGSKKMANVYQSNMQQRSQSSAPNAFETRSKVATKAAFRKS